MANHGISSCKVPNPTLLDTREGVQWRNFHFGLAKLQYTTRASIFLAAFGMGILTSYQFNNPTNVPSWLVCLLSVNSVVLIALHSFAFVIGTCLLPHLKAVNEEYVPPKEGQLVMSPVPSFSPHERFSGFIKNSHRISHVFGLFVFLLEVPLVAWVKFWDVSFHAAIASTVVMFPFLVAFILFYWHFNLEYSIQIYNNRQITLDAVEKLYQCRSRESLKKLENNVMEPEVHQNVQFIQSRRHSFYIETPKTQAPRRKFQSMYNISLDPRAVLS